MDGLRFSRWCWLLLGLTLLGGCNRQDSERLSRIGRKAVERADGLLGGFQTKLACGWQNTAETPSERGLETRVVTRLRADKALADTPMEVTVKDNVVELKGTVRDLVQRRRAVELAESTVGVEKVNDLLQSPN